MYIKTNLLKFDKYKDRYRELADILGKEIEHNNG